MKINFDKTRQKFEESCLSQAKLARKLGVEKSLFSFVLRGKYPCMTSPSAQRVLEELRRRELIVEEASA